MSVVVGGGSSGDDPRLCRYQCPWCGRPEAWPDGCAEELRDVPGPAAFRCADMIEEKCCTEGDHRRCEPDACVTAARWHEPVRHAGVTTARMTGAAWVVVSALANDDVSVVGIADDIGKARIQVRDGFLRRAGIASGSDKAYRVYIVRGSDGGFL